mmetsp:Transcript_87233/g.244809  ORF Transcript_87233/g.244809 Transcript_87233/m.244809 type:complete len:196 (+) Transcript_87233:83-670(+)
MEATSKTSSRNQVRCPWFGVPHAQLLCQLLQGLRHNIWRFKYEIMAYAIKTMHLRILVTTPQNALSILPVARMNSFLARRQAAPVRREDELDVSAHALVNEMVHHSDRVGVHVGLVLAAAFQVPFSSPPRLAAELCESRLGLRMHRAADESSTQRTIKGGPDACLRGEPPGLFRAQPADVIRVAQRLIDPSAGGS